MTYRQGKMLAFIIGILVVIILCLPFIIGVLIQKLDTRALSVYNNKTRIISYKRGWFSSDIVSEVKIPDSEFRPLALHLGISEQNIPNELKFTVQQHVQHGPIFYSKMTQFRKRLGLAVIDRNFVIPQEQTNLLKIIGMDNGILKSDQIYLSFTGKYLNHFQLNNLDMTILMGTRIRFNSLESDLWYWPLGQTFKGNITTNSLFIDNDSTKLFLPTLNIFLNLKKDSHGLWMGSQKLFCPKILVNDADKDFFELNGFSFDSFMSGVNGLIDDEKKITLNKIKSKNQSIGPLQLQISINHLNENAIADLIQAYQVIWTQGEMYESQWQQKLVFALPKIVTAGAHIQLDSFNITPLGNLKIKMNLTWPREKFSEPDTMQDLISEAEGNLNLKVAKPLADSLISFLAKLTYIYQMPTVDRIRLQALDDEIQLQSRLNAFAISELYDERIISEEEGFKLLDLIRDGVSLDAYLMHINDFYWNKRFPPEIYYLLVWQYASLSKNLDNLYKQLHQQQANIKNQINNQLNQLIQKGYITQDTNDYIVSIKRQSGVTKMNGKKWEGDLPGFL